MARKVFLMLLTLVLALSVGLVACGGAGEEEEEEETYDLIIASTAGGSVTTPGEGTFAHDAGAVVDLVAEAEEGYQFGDWTGDVDTVANVNAPSTTIAVNGDYSIMANFEEIPSAALSKDQAIAILASEIIEPAAEYERMSAFMLSHPLQNGDLVTSSSGTDYPITTSTWFVFIDDAPGAGYAHDTRYVFVDADTATYTIVNQNWPPLINGLSMWDTQNLNRGNLIEFWPILDTPVPIAGDITTAPTGDYGDAPDEQLDLYYGITGTFPTLYATTNSHFGRPGGHTLNVGEETLGLNVSAEVDANDPNDPDGVPNLVDADSDERIFVIVDGTQARLLFTVTVASNAPDVTRYVNALIDFDQSGSWTTGAYGTEWVVLNMEVDVAPGSSDIVVTPWFSWGNGAVLPSPAWMRVALTREKVDEALFATVGGWDGSGQFEYGEIEDHLVFLTGNPPPPPDGDGEGDGDGNGNGPPPPGPEDGPCGYKIKYYVLIINCGDSSDHIGEGTPYMQASADRMAAVADAQGYTSMGNLSPNNSGASQTSWDNIADAFQKLADEVRCGDHVLIYICGHGYRSSELPGGGISIANSNGAEQDVLTPSDLALLLAMIPPCEDLDCNLAHHCCHISVIIESCFAGNFNVPGVTGAGISVTGTSTDEESWLTYPRGGVYTYGLDKDLRDPASDTDGDGGVDPVEAHASAEAAVDRHNSQSGKDQDPWNNNQWCKCKCPCQPGIDVEKWAWDEPLEMWADEIEVMLGELVQFRLEIESSGTCRDIIELEVVDSLPDCLEYADGATIYHDGVLVGARPPDSISPVAGGLELYWDLADIGPLAPGESIAIEYGAYAECLGEDINILDGYALCSYDPTVVVRDTDWYEISILPPEVSSQVWDPVGDLYGEGGYPTEGPACIDITALEVTRTRETITFSLTVNDVFPPIEAFLDGAIEILVDIDGDGDVVPSEGLIDFYGGNLDFGIFIPWPGFGEPPIFIEDLHGGGAYDTTGATYDIDAENIEIEVEIEHIGDPEGPIRFVGAIRTGITSVPIEDRVPNQGMAEIEAP